MRKIALYLLATLLVLTVAVPQQNRQPQAPTDGGAGLKLLTQFVGDWTFVDTFYNAQGQPTRSTKGTCKQYLVQGGRFLQSDFTFTPATGAGYTGTGLSVYDAATDRFTTVWYDSRRTELSIRQSKPPFDGKTIELFSTALDPDDAGRMSVARAHLDDNGKTLTYAHFTINADKSERKLFDIVMTRQ